MPASQDAMLEPPLMHTYPNSCAASILQSVKEQEAQFELLTRQLEAERQTVASQLEKFKLRDRDDVGSVSSVSVTGSAEEPPSNWRSPQLGNFATDDQETRPKMTDSHLRYYPDQTTTEYHRYMQDGSSPQVQESYSMNYHTTTSTNGHQVGDGEHSPNSSKMVLPSENTQLVSRTTQQTKTQQVKTVTKVVKTREVRHVGPDGQPLEYNPYGTHGMPMSGPDYVTYPYSGPTDNSHGYGTYDSGEPPSPASQVAPPHSGYPQDYATYGSYLRDYDYGGYPGQAPTPPSVTSESPLPPHAVPQAATSRSIMSPLMVAPEGYNHGHSGYDELEPVPPRGGTEYVQDRYRSTPSPAPHPDRYATYGYLGPPGATSPGYSPGYEGAPPPQGYLDRRPSYDEHHPPGGPGGARAGVPGMGPYGAPHAVFEEEEGGPAPSLDGPPRPYGGPLDGTDLRGGGDVRWRDPDLHEVIEFLGHPNSVVRANAAAYLQHLCYMDNSMKQKTRALGGIPLLIELLNQEIPEIQRNACGALRNLSYGRQNDENKRAIRNAGGIPALVRLLRKTPDNEIRELVTGVLWNLSSCEELKRPIIDDALSVLVNHVIIPLSGWDRNRDRGDHTKPQEIYWTIVFRNANGVLRNVSSAGEYARQKLRECEGLCDALVHLVRTAVRKNDMDNKSVENCVCILRNLSYRCQEVEDPEYDRHATPQPPQLPSRATASALKVGDSLGCFGAKKKKNEALEKQKKESGGAGVSSSGSAGSGGGTPRPHTDPPTGMELLWQPEVVQPYLALLSECSNPETLEAAAGAIQNLAACYWQPSVDIRAAVRKDRGLPVLVELLRMEVDRVVCAVATALRNLAMDQRNKELIGKYAMSDLVQKLPNGNPQHDMGTSDDTIAAVLATLNEVIVRNGDFARSLLEAGGVTRLTYITKQKGRFSARVVKFTSQLLYNMWQHVELREVYKNAGWREYHFLTRTLVARNSSPTSSANNTLSRPISSQGGTRYEDRTLPRVARELNSGQPPVNMPYSRSEELPLSELSHGGPEAQQPGSPQPAQPQQPTLHRPPVGGVPIFPPGPQLRSPPEPVYAQVNKKRDRFQSDQGVQYLPLEQQNSQPAGDSWV
ncbi:catenin delta-2 isoform X2 [Ixodes scapularis]|uniref:catenin delta-2 isoform X2 n=1 Tax=Ixodes scapularis TaxID=6945 RepID=UPI001C3819A4|nr:catenin delta-2 isoform X2 [Ixodes scapularis]XP_042145467.1 catenin delta-2 isoform X2 [Ixodes scapularis]